MSGDLRVVRAIAVTAAPVEHAGPAPDPDAGQPSTAVDDEPRLAAAPRTGRHRRIRRGPGPVERVDTERVPVVFRTAALATPAETSEAADEDARIVILRLLETGQIDVAEAGRRLESLDGPNHTAGEPHHG